jgi:hypothetical protein
LISPAEANCRERSEEAILVEILPRIFAVLASDHGVVLYGLDVTGHLAGATQCDLSTGSANCVPVAIRRFSFESFTVAPAMHA